MKSEELGAYCVCCKPRIRIKRKEIKNRNLEAIIHILNEASNCRFVSDDVTPNHKFFNLFIGQ